jgi:L-threonate 2-dehydrogenase
MAGTVGIIGLGIMGGAISKNLVERGWRVFGTDLDAARQAALTEAGGTACATIAAVCEQAPVILTSLPSPARCRCSAISPERRMTSVCLVMARG